MKQVQFDKVNVCHFFRIVNILSDQDHVLCLFTVWFSCSSLYFNVNFLSSAAHHDQDSLVEEILYLNETCP